MAKQRIFISFDFDHDEDIKRLLAAQAKLDDSPFDFTDGSVKEHLTGAWKAKVKGRMGNCDQVIVLCGEHTHTAAGVSAELEIAQALGKSYFLLEGRSSKTCTKPKMGKSADKMYSWTWPNLKSLVGGAR